MNKASMGRMVIVRTPSPFNNSHFHPGIITHAWKDDYINVKVLPDCGAPYDETSVYLYQTKEEGEKSKNPTRFAYWPPRDNLPATADALASAVPEVSTGGESR